MKKIKRALISLSDKKNLKPLLNCLRKNKIEIISSGGTYKEIKRLKFKASQTVVSFISTINLSELKKMIKVKSKIVRAIPLPPISLKKGPVPICPPNKKVKNFFDKIGSTIEIKNEKLSINFWSTSGMMASYYDMLRVISDWLVKKGIKRQDAQKYITTLFLALSEDAVLIHKKN